MGAIFTSPSPIDLAIRSLPVAPRFLGIHQGRVTAQDRRLPLPPLCPIQLIPACRFGIPCLVYPLVPKQMYRRTAMGEWLGDFGGGGLVSAALWVVAALVLLVGLLVIVRVRRNLSSGTFIAGGRNR